MSWQIDRLIRAGDSEDGLRIDPERSARDARNPW
jgi:hypothetical protein